MPPGDQEFDFIDLQDDIKVKPKINKHEARRNVEEVKKLIKEKGFSKEDFTRILNIPSLIWDEWMRGDRQMPRDYKAMILRIIDPKIYKGMNPKDHKKW